MNKPTPEAITAITELKSVMEKHRILIESCYIEELEENVVSIYVGDDDLLTFQDFISHNILHLYLKHGK